MSPVAWIVLVVLLVPMLGLLAWVIVSASVVRIPPGMLGLLLERGRPTNTTLPPGPHFVFALRRRMVQEYPAIELTYRAGEPEESTHELEQSGPPLRVSLGDRTAAIVPYTVRFKLDPDQLRQVHERLGPAGIFGFVRDESSLAITALLGDPAVTVEELFGPAREECQEQLGQAVRVRLQRVGIDVTGFIVGAVDLGRTGEVIQATARARYELHQEQAEAANRLVQVLNDTELQLRAGPGGEAWRYRETDLLRELVQRTEALQVALHGTGRLGTGNALGPLGDGPPA